jgi:acyl-coenzyme A thioesterase PaaI-like protein
MEGHAAPPPAAVLLGWEPVSADPEAGTIEVAFTATTQFLNSAGVIQGGFLAAIEILAVATATAQIRASQARPGPPAEGTNG